MSTPSLITPPRSLKLHFRRIRKSTQQSTLAMADSKERYRAYLASVPVEEESESEGRREARCTSKWVVRTRALPMRAHVGLIGRDEMGWV
jgi:hypothetical protein